MFCSTTYVIDSNSTELDNSETLIVGLALFTLYTITRTFNWYKYVDIRDRVFICTALVNNGMTSLLRNYMVFESIHFEGFIHKIRWKLSF